MQPIVHARTVGDYRQSFSAPPPTELTLRLVHGPDTLRVEGGGRRPALREAVLTALRSSPAGLGTRQVRAVVAGRGADVDAALRGLAGDGLVERQGLVWRARERVRRACPDTVGHGAPDTVDPGSEDEGGTGERDTVVPDGGA